MKKIGKRICVIGYSNSGKSTFSEKLGAKLNCPVLHIDKIAHIPNTNWEPAPKDETAKKHDAFISGDTWVVDGIYHRCMPNRLEKADTLIFIHANRFKRLFRYLKRCHKKSKQAGAMIGPQKQFNWHMVSFILFKQHKRRKKIESIIADYPHLIRYDVYSFKELDTFI